MELKEYIEKISSLTIDEQNLRNLYLRNIALGKVYGPNIGLSSLDKPWLSMYPEQLLKCRKKYNKILPKLKSLWADDDIIINYYGNDIKASEFFAKVENIAKALKAYGLRENFIIVSSLESVPEFIELLLACEIIGCSLKNYIGEVDDIIKIINSEKNTLLYISPDYLKATDSNKIYSETDIKNIVTINPLYSAGDKKNIRENILDVINSKYQEIVSYDGRNISWECFLEYGKDLPEAVPVIENYRLFSGFTSGSVGKPKEVRHTSESIIGIIDQMSLFPSHEKEKDTWLLTILPPTLVAVVVAMTCYPLADGKKLILDPYCKLEDIDLEMMYYEPQCWACIPIFFDQLLESKRIPENYDMSYFKLFGFGAEPLLMAYITKIQKFLDKHNCKAPLSSGYGQSEGGSDFTVAIGKEMLSSGTAGIPLIDTTIAIFDPITSQELHYNQIGEICKFGPGIMTGYDDENLTSEVLKIHSDDGHKWLHTGDYGFMTNKGLLFVLGRKGIKVYPDKTVFPLGLENKILYVNGVKDAIIVSGIDKDNEGYQLPYLFVIPYENFDQELLMLNLRNFIDNELLDYEKPKDIYFIDKKPINKFKTDRKILQKEYHLI